MQKNAFINQIIFFLTWNNFKFKLFVVLILSLELSLIYSPFGSAENSQEESQIFSQSRDLYKRGDFRQCLRLQEKLIQLNPNQAVYWFNLGLTHYQLKAYEKALTAYQKVIELKSPLSPAAEFYQAQVEMKLKRWGEAKNNLKALLSAHLPKNLRDHAIQLHRELIEKYEMRALAAYKQEKWSVCESILNSIEDDLSDEGKLLLGMTLMKQNKNSESENIFNELLSESHLEKDKKDLVQSLLKNLKVENELAKKWYLSISAGLGYTSNSYLDGQSLSYTSSHLQRYGLSYYYNLNSSADKAHLIGYRGGYETYQSAPDLNTIKNNFYYEFLKQSNGFRWGVRPYYEMEYWNQQFAVDRWGVGISPAFRYRSFEWGVDIDGKEQFPHESSLSYLRGTIYSVSPFLSYWSSFLYLKLSWLASKENIHDISYSDGSTLPLVQSYDGPDVTILTMLTSQLVTSLNVHYYRRVFAHVSQLTLKERVDQEWYSSFKCAYEAFDHLSFYFQTEFTHNQSTLTQADVKDRNYEVITLIGGITSEFF